MTELKKHDLAYGTEGCCTLTFQDEFPEEAVCAHCGKEGARLAFVFAEAGGAGEYICELHENDPEGEGFWLHDAAAFAVYLCRDIKCAEATTKWNQG